MISFYETTHLSFFIHMINSRCITIYKPKDYKKAILGVVSFLVDYTSTSFPSLFLFVIPLDFLSSTRNRLFSSLKMEIDYWDVERYFFFYAIRIQLSQLNN